MKLLLLALAYWLTTFCFSYQAYWIAVLIGLYLYCRLSVKYVCLYTILALYACLHFFALSEAEPISFIGKVVSVKQNYVIVELDKQKVIVSNVAANLHDVITFSGEYEKITGFENLGLFDYRRFRSHQHIHYQLYAKDFNIIQKGKTLPAKIFTWVDHQPNEAFRQIARRFLFQIQEKEEYEFASSVLSSGMHLSILVSWFERLISLFVAETIVPYVVLLFPFGYGLVFGWNLSLLRILGTRILSFTKLNRYHRLALLMILLLIIDPHNAFSLAYIMPITLRLALLFRHHKVPKFLYRCAVFMPILLHTNFQFTFFQAVLITWFRRLFALMHLFCLIGLIIPLFQFPVIYLYHLVLQFMESQEFVFSLGFTMKVSLLFCVLWIGLLCYAMICWKTSIIGLTVLLAILCCFTYLRPWTEVTFLDVGQGDATLITLPYNKGSILIDTGGHQSIDVADMVLLPYLRKKGISALDLVILTHDDIDHRGAYHSLQKKIKVKHLIDQKQTTSENGITKHIINKQPLQFLLQDVDFANDNDNSLIVFVPIHSHSILFMGDASETVEQVLIKRYENLEATILHVGHHGSNTSSNKKFLVHVNPLLAIISSGKKNRYRHPHPDVMERLVTQKISVLDTQDVGSITLYISRFHTFIRTYASRFAIIEAVIS